MRDPIKMEDALGNPIELGKSYGYSASKNGFIDIVLGTALRFTPQKVTITIAQRKRFLYGQPCDPWSDPAPIVSVRPAHLFPITPVDPKM
jgi:hypothetical protein